MINTLFASNTATLSGTALYLGSSGGAQLYHITIGSPLSTTGAAVYVSAGSVNVINSIVVSHTIGLYRTGGTISQDYNLFFSNLTNTLGVSVTGGTHNVIGEPKFMDVAHDNYHLRAGSPAIDQGMNLGIFIDYDGDPRPYNSGFDIGFDEYYAAVPRVYLPMIQR